jgi:cytoplasmic iron level regulating protein YaaA (DUF328/UPF0246 family)
VLVLLPPSETKRDGGEDDSALDLASLSFPELTPQRGAALAALRRLSRSVADSTTALRLGPTQRFEIDRNRALGRSPVMPALERYTGVLYDGLAVATLSPTERDFAARHLAIHSALFGLLGAADRIPAYRCSHDSQLPGLSLRMHWRDAITAAIAARPGLVLDLRSESYTALGPAAGGFLVRVVAEDASRRRLAISHANKHEKGRFVRQLVSAGHDHDTVDSLLAWAAARGIRLDRSGDRVLDLIAG